MDQQRFGDLIKKIRKSHNLTQEKLADKLGVTYQAVSKWENGKCIPDITILKQISKDYNIDLNSLLEGNNKPKKKYYIYISVFVIFIIIGLLLYFHNKQSDFEFKTISTTCSSFKITGSMAYNKDKSSIYISDVNYCGGNDIKKYIKINCTLYEVSKNSNIKISEYNYKEKGEITLEDFLKKLKFNIEDYKTTCNDYSNNSLFIEINAYDNNNEITTYKIPLELKDNCTD